MKIPLLSGQLDIAVMRNTDDTRWGTYVDPKHPETRYIWILVLHVVISKLDATGIEKVEVTDP